MKHMVVTEGTSGVRIVLARLEVGEEILASLKDLARRQSFPSASLTALGAANDVTLALYDPVANAYRETRLREDLEVASLVGDVAWLGDEPSVHAHGVFSRADCSTVAGHVMRGIVSVTLEVMLHVHTARVERRPDAATGLNLLHLG